VLLDRLYYVLPQFRFVGCCKLSPTPLGLLRLSDRIRKPLLGVLHGFLEGSHHAIQLALCGPGVSWDRDIVHGVYSKPHYLPAAGLADRGFLVLPGADVIRENGRPLRTNLAPGFIGCRFVGCDNLPVLAPSGGAGRASNKTPLPDGFTN